MKRLYVLIPFIISMITHLSIMLLIFIMAAGGNGDSDKNGNGKTSGRNNHDGVKDVDVIAKTTKIDIEIVEIPKPGDAVKKMPKKKVVIADKECPGQWYGGIGIRTLGDTVTSVYEGYPADIAGIMINDTIISSGGDNVTGEPGTTVILTIMRDGVKIVFNIVRGKVCYKAEK